MLLLLSSQQQTNFQFFCSLKMVCCVCKSCIYIFIEISIEAIHCVENWFLCYCNAGDGDTLILLLLLSLSGYQWLFCITYYCYYWLRFLFFIPDSETLYSFLLFVFILDAMESNGVLIKYRRCEWI